MHDIESLAAVATGRTASLFADDLAETQGAIRAAVEGRRLLIIGGAGTIGSSTTELLTRFSPAAVHLVDQNENGLAELTRNLRSREGGLGDIEFKTFPIDYGSAIMGLVFDTEAPYDLVLNFAALKHVRSEKDVPSLLQMLDTNLVKNRSLMDRLAESGFAGRYFCVSTDKAANPVSLMGASKRVMEHLIFSRACTPEFRGGVTSARFANVAFSDGSLLQSFVNRLAKKQPLVAPRATSRYFVSPRESGEICAIAALIAPPDSILVPRLDPAEHLVELEAVARGFLAAHGLEVDLIEDEETAKRAARSAARRYPLVLSALDTSGEKPYEEFVGSHESVRDVGLHSFEAVSYVPAPAGSLEALLDMVDRAMSGTAPLDKGALVSAIAAVVPELRHKETGRNLDGRM
ncbi:polysaccharide biosynthesis protein [Methylorubrum extorquens]|nr:polysaccharide biosynthesis protein [Methylorubrum extorquens]